MKIEKKVIAELEMVYSVSPLEISGETHLVAATEDHGPCLLFSPPDWIKSVVWNGPGGTMDIIPYEKGSFFAIQKFFPIFQSEGACIVYAEPGQSIYKEWKVRKVVDLPFVHRIGLVNIGKTKTIIASTLCGGKDYQNNWSKPGAVYM
jgi:hypothetical protein